jgi:LacI family transcriptional regulator
VVRPPINIRDVAKKAGVSVGTVSRVMNGHPSVTPHKQQLVNDAIAALNYRPDAFAQSLRRGTNRTIGVIIPDLRNPFFADLIQLIEIRARALGYSVLFVSSEEDAATEAELIETLAQRRVDGIILAPSHDASRIPTLSHVPIVVVDRAIDGHACVSADHRAGSRLVAEYLVSIGHRRIACVTGPLESVVARARLAGFLDVMAPYFHAAGLPIADYIAHGSFDYVGGRDAARQLLDSVRPAPTAIFACSDQQAIGVLRVAADCGLIVPRDLSVVGFDGIMLADLVTPRLTTVVQPVAQLAEAAVTMLLQRKGNLPNTVPELFACTLVTRESCAPPVKDGSTTAR